MTETSIKRTTFSTTYGERDTLRRTSCRCAPHFSCDALSRADSLTLEQTLFRVSRNYDMEEKIKLEYMKVIGTAHMRILDGLDSLLQLSGLLAKLCLIQA